MADEESEVRRMAEIADAINAILEAEPDAVGDTTAVRRTHRGADKHGRNHEAFQLRVEGDTEVPREVVQRGVDDAEVVAEGERAEARDEHARQNPHEQLAALQGLKLGFGLTSLEVGGG